MTDAGLKRLEGLAQLPYLDLRYTAVTAAGVAAFAARRPTVRVDCVLNPRLAAPVATPPLPGARADPRVP